jgi:hypothetical protein
MECWIRDKAKPIWSNNRIFGFWCLKTGDYFL